MRTPVERKPGRGLSQHDQRTNREYVRVCFSGDEQSLAQLKAYKVLRRVRISLCWIGTLAWSIYAAIRLRTSLTGVRVGKAHLRHPDSVQEVVRDISQDWRNPIALVEQVK